MPAYNAGKYIEEAIASVLQQSFTDFELIIIDDGSEDNTEAITRHFDDSRIVYVYQPNQGVAVALNKGLQIAKGKYIARIDADDIAMSDRIEQQFFFLENNPGYVIVGSDAAYTLEDGEHLFDFSCLAHEHEAILNKLYFYCPFIHSSVMYLKEPVIQAGSYTELAHSFEDYFLWVHLAKAGKMHNLSEKLMKIRFNPSSVTIDEKWRGKRFRNLKRSIIRKGAISREEGAELLEIIQKQDTKAIKWGAYYALCSKKWLTDNFQPAKARQFALKSLRMNPFRLETYLLLVAGFFPQSLLQWFHRRSPNKL
jgi:glycosyltransferase involved in cell wall biosynthesis